MASSVVIHPQLPQVANDDIDPTLRVWQSCCLKCDKDVVLYASKMLFSVGILAFSMWSIAVEENECKDMGVYFGLIGLVAGSVVESGSSNMVPTRH